MSNEHYLDKLKVVCYKKIPKDLIEILTKEGINVVEFDGVHDSNKEAFHHELRTAHGTLGTNFKFDEALLKLAPVLRVCSTISVGYDAFNVSALSQQNIALMHTPGILNDTMADTVMALVLSTARKIVNVAERVKKGEWVRTHLTLDWYGLDVHHKTMGIVGMGRIGEVLAKRAHCGFDMNILYYSRTAHKSVEEKYQAKRVELQQLLSESDYICVILPMSDETYHMFSYKEFAAMKPTAIFVNAGRGPVVDEQALIQALKENKIAGAGLDVFEQEPISMASPLLQLSNVVAVPHIGTSVPECHYNMAKLAIENLLRALKGDFSQNCVNKDSIISNKH